MLTKLMSDQSGKYEAVPPSDIEEQQESDYGDDADYKSEEEVPLLSTRSIARTSSLPLLIFICISLIGLGLKLSFDLHSLNEDASQLALYSNASAATHEHVHTFETRGGGAISLYKVQWEDQPGHTEDTYVCHLQSVCIERHQDPETGSAKKEFWLMGHPEEEVKSIAGLDKLAFDAFQACLGHSYSQDASHNLAIKSARKYKGEVAWVHGHTLAIPRSDMTPIQSGSSLLWLQAWSRFMSWSISATPDFLRKIHLTTRRFFGHVLLLDQTLAMNQWHKTIFRVSQSAAFAGLVRPRLAAGGPYLQKMPIRDGEWMDHYLPSQELWGEDSLGFDEATCYENMLLVAPSKQFFRDRGDANYFRSWAFHEAGKPQNRSIPTRLKDLKVVLLLRSDKPMWNHKRLLNTMNQTGIHNIQLASLNDASTYEAQIELWSNADIVISDDHDALTGQTLMRPGTGVLEVFPPFTYDNAHEILAAKTGVHYISATTTTPVSANTVQAERPCAMSSLDRARHFAGKYPNQEACQSSVECQAAMYDLGAYIDDAHFRAGLRELLRKMSPPHHCMEK